MKRWMYQDDLVTRHRIYFLWYVIAFLVAMWTVPAPEPSWGLVVHFRPIQSDCIVAHMAMRERSPVAINGCDPAQTPTRFTEICRR